VATLTKKDIAIQLSNELGFSVRESKKIVDTFFHVVADILFHGEEVKLVRFGTFSPTVRAYRFKDGNKNTVAFHPSRWLKGRLNGGKEVLQDQ